MNIDILVEELGKLTLVEAIELTKQLKEKWNIKDEVPKLVTVEPEKLPDNRSKIVDVILKACGNRKIEVIKLLREVKTLGLVEAKKFAETPNSKIAEGITLEEAEPLANRFQVIGAEIEIVNY